MLNSVRKAVRNYDLVKYNYLIIRYLKTIIIVLLGPQRSKPMYYKSIDKHALN